MIFVPHHLVTLCLVSVVLAISTALPSSARADDCREIQDGCGHTCAELQTRAEIDACIHECIGETCLEELSTHQTTHEETCASVIADCENTCEELDVGEEAGLCVLDCVGESGRDDCEDEVMRTLTGESE